MVALVREHDARFLDQPLLAGVLGARRRARDVRDRGDVVPVDAVAEAQGERRDDDAERAPQSGGEQRRQRDGAID